MIKRITLLGLMLAIHVAYSQSAAETLQAKLNAIQSMSANFSQVVKAKKREISRSSGSMAMERPGRFRWQTKTPMAQVVVADRKNLWIYDVDLEQVTVKKQGKGLGGTPALFLSGYDNTVTRDFTVTLSNQGGQERYALKAKSHKANFQRVGITFSGDKIVALDLDDQLGQHTHVNLTQVKNNPQLSPKLFKFSPPKGVDVVRQ